MIFILAGQRNVLPYVLYRDGEDSPRLQAVQGTIEMDILFVMYQTSVQLYLVLHCMTPHTVYAQCLENYFFYHHIMRKMTVSLSVKLAPHEILKMFLLFLSCARK